jgi:8-amino-7-oxononanoate synthase
MSLLDEFAESKLAGLAARNLRRELIDTVREDGFWIRRGERHYLSFSCNDYLGLSHHPEVKAAMIAAIERYGAGAGASRLVTGNHPLYAEIETRLARFKGTEAACVFGSGFLANIGIVPALIGPGDLLLVDALSHSCIFAGAQLSRAHVEVFRHNDVVHLDELLEAKRDQYRHALVLTDGVFSMDGDLAPLGEIGRVARAHDAWLMTDDAHGFGVLGGGRGSAYAFETKTHIDLQMGTLSKALGSYGGYLCASKSVVDLIRTRARSLIYSTALPSANVGAALAALAIVERDSELCDRPLRKARLFTHLTDLPQAQSPIVPVLLGHPVRALAAQALLERHGFLVVAIRPPTVPADTTRLRFTFTAAHPDEEIERLAGIVRDRILEQPA